MIEHILLVMLHNLLVYCALIFWWLGLRKWSFLFQNIEIQELSGDDYFSKNNEFSTWLKEEKDVFFSDLSAESSRKLFSDFVKAWNKRKLESRYYEGIATAPRSAHNWKIKGWKATLVVDLCACALRTMFCFAFLSIAVMST